MVFIRKIMISSFPVYRKRMCYLMRAVCSSFAYHVLFWILNFIFFITWILKTNLLTYIYFIFSIKSTSKYLPLFLCQAFKVIKIYFGSIKIKELTSVWYWHTWQSTHAEHVWNETMSCILNRDDSWCINGNLQESFSCGWTDSDSLKEYL